MPRRPRGSIGVAGPMPMTFAGRHAPEASAVDVDTDDAGGAEAGARRGDPSRRRQAPRRSAELSTASGSTGSSSPWRREFSRNHLAGSDPRSELAQVRLGGAVVTGTLGERSYGPGRTSCRSTLRADRREPGVPGRRRCRWRWSSRTMHLMVVDKAAGMVVHPAAGNWSGTLAEWRCSPGNRRVAALPRAGIVHRLDKDTSGLMVVGQDACPR